VFHLVKVGWKKVIALGSEGGRVIGSVIVGHVADEDRI
jgi:hypothetical protein